MTFFPQERSLTLYEGPMSSSVGHSDPKICFNSTTDVHYQVGGDDDDDNDDDDDDGLPSIFPPVRFPPGGNLTS